MTQSDDHISGQQINKRQLPSLPKSISNVNSPLTGRLDAAIRSAYDLSHKAARKLISTGKVSVSGIQSVRWETAISEGEVITINPLAPSTQLLKSGVPTNPTPITQL